MIDFKRILFGIILIMKFRNKGDGKTKFIEQYFKGESIVLEESNLKASGMNL